jgi:hypothetical protein
MWQKSFRNEGKLELPNGRSLTTLSKHRRDRGPLAVRGFPPAFREVAEYKVRDACANTTGDVPLALLRSYPK